MYRAVFEYEAVQKDELSLRKGEMYSVMERCHDGWFKGKNVKTGETGVFPGNYVKEYDGKQVQCQEIIVEMCSMDAQFSGQERKVSERAAAACD